MNQNSPAQTLVFSEGNNTFESFLSYSPDIMCCVGNLLVSFKDGVLYTHDDEDNYNNFYGVSYESYIIPVFNKQSPVKKKYLAFGYEGNSLWHSPTIGDVQTSTINPQTNLQQVSKFFDKDIILEETVSTVNFQYDANSKKDPREGILNGDFLGGNWITVKIRNAGTFLTYLFAPYVTYVVSNRNF